MVLEADIQCSAHAVPSANAVCSCASIPSMGTDKVLEYWVLVGGEQMKEEVAKRYCRFGNIAIRIAALGHLCSQHGLVHTYGCY